MKKVLSVFLAALMLVSCFGMMAFAEDGGEVKEPAYVRFKFLVPVTDAEGKVTEIDWYEMDTLQIENYSVITSGQMNTWLSEMPKKVEMDYSYTEDNYTRTETKSYTFLYFTIEGGDDEFRVRFEGTGETKIGCENPDPENPIVFVAHYEEKDTKDNTTFWEFVQSIFARINLIFEYFSEIFGF